MTTGKVIAIYIAPQRGEPTVWMDQVHVLPGHGIQGDRYFHPSGKLDSHQRSGRQITLIEMEAIERICQEGISISPDKTRRNIVTRGVSLNDLVGKDFMVGEIKLRGVRLCEPCDYLASRTHPDLKQSMSHRGGLRADIISEGFIHINDPITASLQEST